MNPITVELDHAWKWFEYHATQRMTVFRFYLIMVGAIGAGYIASLKDNDDLIALIIAIFGASGSILFWRLDQRVSDLIKHGEDALSQIEDRLAKSSRIKNIRIIDRMEKKSNRLLNSYRRIFCTMFILAFGSFFIAAIYALIRAIDTKQFASILCNCLGRLLNG
jgi:hypothetical protein